MAPFRTLTALVLSAGAVSGFAPANTLVNTREAITSQTTSSLNTFSSERGTELMETGMEKFKEDFPAFSKWGWGPSVHAEKWNGRHAMFGWFFICATAYFKGHGLIPDATAMLTYKEWGPLAEISGFGKSAVFISNERAIVLIANVHAFMVGLAATIAPLPWQDPLLLDPDAGEPYERAVNTKPYGVLPDMSFDKWGLTETAEIMNGRMAMFGLVMLVGTSLVDGKPILDVVNDWVGNLYY